MERRFLRVCVVLAVWFVGPATIEFASAAGQECEPQRVHRPVPLPGVEFGFALAMHEDWAMVGAHRDHNMTSFVPGAVYAYQRVGGEWTLHSRFNGHDSSSSDSFGRAVAVHSNQMVVGSPFHDPSLVVSAGAAYAFELLNGDWVQTAKLLPPTNQAGTLLGWSVAIQDDTIAVGSPGRSLVGFDSGALFVYRRVNGTWALTDIPMSSQHQWGDRLGHSVAIDGDWLVGGAIGIDGPIFNLGGAFVWKRTPTGWEESARLVPWETTGVSSDLQAGWAVAVSGNRVAIGVPVAVTGLANVGAVFVFAFEQGAWVPLTKLLPPDTTHGVQAGGSLSASGGYLLVGGRSRDEGILASGSAFLFKETFDGYRFVRKFRSPLPQVDAFFGTVAYHDGTVLIGSVRASLPCSSGLCQAAGDAWFFEAPTFAAGYCFGASCPCGNLDPARGCANSGGFGADLVACGSASLAADDLVLTSERLPAGQAVLLFGAAGPLAGGQGLPFGDGLRCIGGGPVRLAATQSGPSGRASFGPGLALAAHAQPGQPWHFQAWYRDSAPSPCGTTFNTTHALAFDPAP